MTTRDISEMTGLAPSAIRNRLFKQGMSLELVISEPPKTHKNKRKEVLNQIVAPVTRCEPVEVTEVSDTERGTGGFGSTGV